MIHVRCFPSHNRRPAPWLIRIDRGGAKNVAWRYQVRIPVGPDICHRGCAYAVLRTAQRYGVYSVVYDTVHYKKNPLKSFEIRVGHSRGFGLHSIAILSQCAESGVNNIYIT